MRILAIFIVVCSTFLAWTNWGDIAGYGWLVGVTGWIDKCFGD